MSDDDQFYNMLDKLPYGVGLYTTEDLPRALYLNDAYFRLIGYSRKEYAVLADKTFDAFVFEEDRRAYADNMRKIGENSNIVNSEYRIRCKNEVVRWIQLNVTRTELDGTQILFASFADITEVKEDALSSAYADERYRLVMESAKAAVFEWNESNKTFYSSELFSQYALSIYPIKGIYSGALFENGVHPEDLPVFRKYLADIAAHKPKTESILRLLMKDGSYHWSRLICLVTIDTAGMINRVIGTILDINDEMEKSVIQRELMQAIPGGVAIFKVLGDKLKCLYYNEGVARRDHRTREEFQAIFDKDSYEDYLIAPDDRERFKADAMDRAKSGLPINITYRYLRDDKTLSNRFEWLHLTASKIREEDGCPVYYAIMTIPSQENMMYRSIVEGSLTAAVLMEERTGSILMANHAFRVSFAHGDKASLIGENIKDAIAKDVAAELLCHMENMVPDALREDLYTTENGRYLMIQGKKMTWNGVDACLFYLSDQTILKHRNDELMKAQSALRDEQELLRLAMHNAKMASWDYDCKNHRLIQSEESRLLTGLPTVIENMPEAVISTGIVHPDDVGAYRALFNTPADISDPTVQCDVHIRHEGIEGYAWERVVMTHLFDGSGQYLKSIGSNTDVTQEKESEIFYQMQMHNMADLDEADLIAKGRINLTKNKKEYYLSYSDEAIDGQEACSYDELLYKISKRVRMSEQTENLINIFDRNNLIFEFQKGNTTVSAEYQRLWIKTPISWVRLRCILTTEPKTGDVIGFFYSYDISDEKIAASLLEKVVWLDYDFFALLDCRSNSYKLYGQANESVSPIPPLSGNDYEESYREYAESYLSEDCIQANIVDMSITNVKKQLEKQDIFCCYADVVGNKGEMRRKKLQFSYVDRMSEKVLITRSDITEIFAKEQQRLNEQKSAAEAVRKANSVKNDFLSNMSHDLRTPMNAIIGLSKLAQDELDDPKAMKEYVDGIQSAGQFLLGLVNDCLDFEKLAAHKMTLMPVPYSYEEFRRSIVTMIVPLCKNKNISFLFSETAPYTVCIDKVRFEQIMFNLLSNSVKYTNEGGKIEFTADSHLNKDESMVICDFHVRDNGIGMSEEFQKHLFEPFVQEASNGISSQQGTGLGLSIVNELVSLMDGTIRIDSKQGVGTEVIVHLDMQNVTDKVKLTQETDPETTVESLDGKHVLLLEDNQINMKIAKCILEKRGIIVDCAENGEKDLERLADHKEGDIDVILTDVRMPVMDGLEFARRVRALKRRDAMTIPIIAMTANAFEEDIQETLNAGINAHLTKPVDPDMLYSTLEKYCTKSDLI